MTGTGGSVGGMNPRSLGLNADDEAERPWTDDDTARIDLHDTCTWNPYTPYIDALGSAAAGDFGPLSELLTINTPLGPIRTATRDGVTVTYHRPFNEVITIILAVGVTIVAILFLILLLVLAAS